MGIDGKSCGRDEVTALSAAEVAEHLRKIPRWSVREGAIMHEYAFRDFREAMEFVNRVAALAEAEDHHPDICISYNKVQITLSTHKVGGLSCRDFILGAKIDLAAGSGR